MSEPVIRVDTIFETLLHRLRSDGILVAGEDQPIVDRNGKTAPWMFYSWNLSLTAESGVLAAQCLLETISQFQSTQLSTFGTTAIPLLTGCVLFGNGKYKGIVVREAPKGTSYGRQIEGPADRTKPVLIIDDSLSSGTSVLNGIRVLEKQGFLVEGAVCLVYFPHRGGRERLQALGYRVEILFDIWRDLKMPVPNYIPGNLRCGDLPWAQIAVEDGLSLPEIARKVAEHFAQAGEVLLPPRRLDRDYGTIGGVWVSFRNEKTEFRIARDGFWHFDQEEQNLCRDIVLATAKAMRATAISETSLSELKIGVTLFGELERIQPSALDFSRFGIVVRSLAWPTKLGGALPNTQVFTSEREQLNLALRNAGLNPFEPYELYRHTIFKTSEAGKKWLPYGAEDGPEYRWTTDAAIGEQLTQRVVQVIAAARNGEEIRHDDAISSLIKTKICAVGVTLYRNGVVGCAISGRPDLDDAIVMAARSALNDKRFAGAGSQLSQEFVPAVSVLFDREWVGWVSSERAARKFRLGRDSLTVQRGSQSAWFLESVGPHYCWDKPKVVEKLLEKARLERGPANWTTYRTATWLRHEGRAVRRDFGFAPPSGPADEGALEKDLGLLGNYIEKNLIGNGLPCYAQNPVLGWFWETGSAARILHGLTGLLAAAQVLNNPGWRDRATHGLRMCLQSVDIATGRLTLQPHRSGPMADCEMLTAAAQAGLTAEYASQTACLISRISAMYHQDGAVYPAGQAVRADRDNDYLPNAAVMALATCPHDPALELDTYFEEFRKFQLTRFRCLHGWGQVGWVPQSCAAVFRATGCAVYARTAFEVIDWCLDWQVEETGAFLTDLSAGGPTFYTAFVAEAIADAWEMAIKLQDHTRAARYQQAWQNAMRFVCRLIIRPADAPCLRIASRAIGGVRGTLDSSMVRIDYVSHVAIAIRKGLENGVL